MVVKQIISVPYYLTSIKQMFISKRVPTDKNIFDLFALFDENGNDIEHKKFERLYDQQIKIEL